MMLKPKADEPPILVQLVETSCLLELAKLTTAQLDLPSYAQSTVELLSQLLPVEAVVVDVALPDLPRITASTGTVEPHSATYPLSFDGAAAGALVVHHDAKGLVTPRLLSAIADQLSSGLARIVEAERLRRQVAHRTALTLATALGRSLTAEGLDHLAGAVAALPDAVGGRVVVDAADASIPMVSGVGATGSVRTVRRASTTLGSRVVVEAVWAGTHERDPRAVEAVLDALVVSLEQAEMNRVLREQAETDPLTRLGNRRRVERALAAAASRANRLGAPFAVITIDLDRFKPVNDTLGHATGDRLLQVIAELLLSSVRPTDVVARLGGDEFIVVCNDTDEFGARRLAERITTALPRACAAVLPTGWRQTASIGVASAHSGDTSNVETLLARADAALYEQKATRHRTAPTPVQARCR